MEQNKLKKLLGGMMLHAIWQRVVGNMHKKNIMIILVEDIIVTCFCPIPLPISFPI